MLSTGITVTVADPPGGAVGQTVGEGINATITLDTTAANYNWFIDPTPSDNSEYLPTSNPYEWVANAGTAAFGKIDMLSSSKRGQARIPRNLSLAPLVPGRNAGR